MRQLEAFIAVAETNNFTRASERLGMAQPMVSGLVRELEIEIGFRLFDRTTRRVRPTDAAAEFLTDARRLVGEIESAIRRARDVGTRKRGHIKVGAPPLLAAALLPGVIRTFERSSPGVAVTIVDRSVAAINELLLSGEIDLALGTFRQDEEAIVRIPLVSSRFVLMCPADNPLAAVAHPRWSDLANVPMIALRRGNGIREQIERGYASAGLDAKPAFELDQLTTVFAMVENGFGITILPRYALGALRAPTLVTRLLVDPVVAREIDVAHREDRSLSPAGLEFVRLLRLSALELQRQTSETA
ncbi:LysR family transcriptional regulator [Bradyrhizobium sp. Lot33]